MGYTWAGEAPTSEEAVHKGCVEFADPNSGLQIFIMYQATDYTLYWQVHEADGTRNGLPAFASGRDYINTPTTDSILVEGFVKWDGCTQFMFPHSGYLHYDHPDDVPDLRAIVRQVWALAAEYVANWDSP
jgi:hypothetical protein